MARPKKPTKAEAQVIADEAEAQIAYEQTPEGRVRHLPPAEWVRPPVAPVPVDVPRGSVTQRFWAWCERLFSTEEER